LKNKLGRSLALFVGFLLSCGLAIAHHGNSAYDEKNPLTVKGTVTEFAWSNPHVQIYFDVKDDRGNVAHWSVETLSPGKLLRCGWTRDSVSPNGWPPWFRGQAPVSRFVHAPSNVVL
jgi:hypothetical protein